ncbi:phage portal protein [Alishewanella sp. SMS8]|uniref:phage portal protein n=1 Tax=Alishewanella sp. SMS8 TaxID=2994676 RepID=UPI002740B99C|nr:phage portal protein [Alishewanella sp. SMS8]MDP5205800.1 phage portal protein [Alishewanella sp. SMS9]MDP5459882.1 phage portal protein [Alishewanella sp. SMS8]
MSYRKSVIVGLNGQPLMMGNSAYQGASYGRRMGGVYAPGTGINTLLNYALSTLRNRSRAGHRNMPLLRSGIEKKVTNEIGIGITPRAKCADQELRKAINKLWDESCFQFDPEGNLDVYGMQAQISRARRLSGECFIRARYRSANSNLLVPIQFQVLEADFVPLEYNDTLGNGNRIIAGIEFNRSGQRVAYHMYREHPGEMYNYQASLANLVRVPASEVAHHFNPLHPGQIRGEPDSAASLVKAQTFDSYDDAELVRKQTRAPYTGAIYRENISEEDYLFDPITGEPLDDNSVMKAGQVEAGTMLELLPGERIDLFKGDDTGQGYGDFMRWQSLMQAAGMDMPYELLTGDWEKVNDRLVRAVLNEFRRRIQMDQWHLMIPQVMRWMRWHWLNRAVLAGRINMPGYATKMNEYHQHTWCPHGWPYINPNIDVEAKINAIDADLVAHEDVVAESGDDLTDIQERNKVARNNRGDRSQQQRQKDNNDE